MKFPIRHMLLAASVMLSIVSFAIPDCPSPQRLVNDYADIFTPEQETRLEKILVAFDDTTSNQITVVTVENLEGYAASEYATRIGLEWKVGSGKFDNGIVLLVKPKTADSYGEVFIAVGYGLEGAIPDAYAKRIVDNVLIPHFQSGDYYTGVESACQVLMKLASGEISDPREMEEDVDLWSIIIVISFIAILIYITSAFHDKNNGSGGNVGRRIVTGGTIINTGGNFGGRYSGGGGFGGFGGGSFGGGGAGGRW